MAGLPLDQFLIQSRRLADSRSFLYPWLRTGPFVWPFSVTRVSRKRVWDGCGTGKSSVSVGRSLPPRYSAPMVASSLGLEDASSFQKNNTQNRALKERICKYLCTKEMSFVPLWSSSNKKTGEWSSEIFFAWHRFLAFIFGKMGLNSY